MRALKEAYRNQVAVHRSDDRGRGGGERTLRGVLSTAIILHGRVLMVLRWVRRRHGRAADREVEFWAVECTTFGPRPIDRFSLQLSLWAVKASARIQKFNNFLIILFRARLVHLRQTLPIKDFLPSQDFLT